MQVLARWQLKANSNGHCHLIAQEFPELPPVTTVWETPSPLATDWPALLSEVLSRGAAVPEVTWCQPGEAHEVPAVCACA
jgi:hypothetical protein